MNEQRNMTAEEQTALHEFTIKELQPAPMNISDAARELLPCPFCGSEKVGLSYVPNTGGNVCYYSCNKCSAHGPWSNHHVVRDNWNTRDTTATVALTLELETVKRERDEARSGWFFTCIHHTDAERKATPFVTCPVCARKMAQQLAEARELLKERVFWTANDPAFDRQGYSALIDSETAFRDVNYRNAPLYATAEEAIQAALNPPTDEK